MEAMRSVTAVGLTGVRSWWGKGFRPGQEPSTQHFIESASCVKAVDGECWPAVSRGGPGSVLFRHPPEQVIDVGPELLPLFALVGGQLGERVLVADGNEGGNLLPIPQEAPDQRAVLQGLPRPGGQVGPEPVVGLLTQTFTLVV